MTYIEQAIKEAVESGEWYKAKDPENDELAKTVLIEQMTKHTIWAKIFLDPTFWQALGKAREWEERDHLGFKFQPPLWKKKWYRFIDHLAEGRDAESFFKELLGR